MKVDFTADPAALQNLTGFESFTNERFCMACTSVKCPGKKLIQVGQESKNRLIDEYPCFVKARLLIDCSVEETRKLLLNNLLLRYVGIKTQAVTRTTTRRGAYGTLGTLLVLLKDFLDHFDGYDNYPGMLFNDYLKEVRLLPGCSKVQNHAINHRLNQEFRKFFGQTVELPVQRIPVPSRETVTRYKINQGFFTAFTALNERRKVAKLLLDILSLYFFFRERGNAELIEQCREMLKGPLANEDQIVNLFKKGITHNDARMFEISSFVVLRAWYANKEILIGPDSSALERLPLRLYKTGRVSANDGGINFVLVPLGKFFQATQDLNLKKFFLDIDKVSRYPISFVIQTTLSSDEALRLIREKAQQEFADPEIVERYLGSIETIFTLQDLNRILDDLHTLSPKQRTAIYKDAINEFISQYSVEYNIS
jgi:hypothetical protein